MAQWLRPLSILLLQRTPSLVPSTHMAVVTIVPRTLKPSLASAGTGRAHGVQTDMGANTDTYKTKSFLKSSVVVCAWAPVLERRRQDCCSLLASQPGLINDFQTSERPYLENTRWTAPKEHPRLACSEGELPTLHSESVWVSLLS